MAKKKAKVKKAVKSKASKASKSSAKMSVCSCGSGMKAADCCGC